MPRSHLGSRRRWARPSDEREVFSSDLQLGLPGNRYVYGNVTVVWGEVRLQRGTDGIVENPNIVVSQTFVRVEQVSRGADGSWIYRVAEAGGRITLSNGAVLDVDALYAGVFEIPGD